MASNQLLLSGAVVAAIYYLYVQGKKILENQDNDSGQVPAQDGLDPNWPGGKPIGVDNPVNVHDVVPTCQVWDDNIQLFVKTSNPDWSKKDAQYCFTNATAPDLPAPDGGPAPLLRFVDATGNISFNRENPLAVAPSEYGTCFFTDKNNTFYSFPGYAPVNGSARLCFNAGDTIDQSGKLFQQEVGSGQNFRWNPELDFDQIYALVAANAAINPAFEAATPSTVNSALGSSITPVTVSPNQPYCEMEWYGVSNWGTQNVLTDEFWVHDTLTAPYDNDQKSCLNAAQGILLAPGRPTTTRWVDPANNIITYLNPETGEVIQRDLRDNL